MDDSPLSDTLCCLAYVKAAQTTLDYGYDKFLIATNNASGEVNAYGMTYGGFSATPDYASGQVASSSGTITRPQVKMIIKMLHSSEKGADKAIDAKAVMQKNQN